VNDKIAATVRRQLGLDPAVRSPVAKTTREPPAKRASDHLNGQGYLGMTDDEIRERLAGISEITDECEIVDTGLQVLVPEDEEWD